MGKKTEPEERYIEFEGKKIAVCDPYLPRDKAEELLKWAQSTNFTKGYKGGTSMYMPYKGKEDSQDDAERNARDERYEKGDRDDNALYLSFDDRFGVLYSLLFKNFVTPEEYRKTMVEVRKLYDSRAKVAPILGYMRETSGLGIGTADYNPGRHGGERDLVFVARAPGRTLNDTRDQKRWYTKTSERLSHLSAKSHYDDVTETFMQLLDSPIKPDISGNNMLHHPVGGFNFIDFNRLKKDSSETETSENVKRFLGSFVFPESKKFSHDETGQRIERDYLIDTARELMILINLLYGKGITEEDLVKAIARIPRLGTADLTKLEDRSKQQKSCEK